MGTDKNDILPNLLMWFCILGSIAILLLGCASTPLQKWGTAQTSASAALEGLTICSQAGELRLEDMERIDVLVDVIDIALGRAKGYAETGQVDLMQAALDMAYKAIERLELKLEEEIGK